MSIRHFISLLAGLLLLTSCFKITEQEYIYTNFYAFGTVYGQVLHIEPGGLDFVVTEDKTDGKWSAEPRIFFCCDVLQQVETGRYSIRIKDYDSVISRAALVKGATDESVYGSDAVSFYQDWGLDSKNRIINILALTTSLKNSDKVHTVNLVFDDARSHTDTLFYELRHQGFGESYENTGYEATDFQLDYNYLTFDLSGTIPSGAGESIVISIEWDWFPANDLSYMEREPEHQQACGILNLQ